VVFAIGQVPEDLSNFGALNFSEHQKFIITDEDRYTTNIPDVFAAGDIVAGSSKTVVHAVAAGKRAAESIDEYLSKQRG
jgi:thioredoxin reductase